MRRLIIGFLAVALIMSVTAGCAPVPSGSGTYTPPAAEAAADNGFPYGARLGEVSEGELPGTVSAEVWFPMYDDRGVWARVVDVEGGSPFTRTLCEVSVDVWGDIQAEGSHSCDYAVHYSGGEREGFSLYLRDVPANVFYEVDVRGLGGGSALQPKLRTVITLGKLSPSGAPR